MAILLETIKSSSLTARRYSNHNNNSNSNNTKEEEGEGDDGEVVKQQEDNHKSDLEIAELCTDVEVDFLSQECVTR
jgi:hypothetical protein